MSMDPSPARVGWAPGTRVDTLFRRLDGSIAGVHPMTIVSDDGALLLGAVPVGTSIQRGVLADGREIRDAALGQRFRLPRKLVRPTWNRTSTLRLIDEDHWSSVWWFFDGDDGRFQGWYVNLEIPLGRNESAVIRFDGVLDIWVNPDRSWNWKDEDEFAAALDAGRFDANQAALLRAEGHRVAALAEDGVFPFDGTHTDFGF